MSFLSGQVMIKNDNIFQITDSVYNEGRGRFEYILSDIETGKVMLIDSTGIKEYNYLTPTMLMSDAKLRRRYIRTLNHNIHLDFLVEKETNKKVESLKKRYSSKSKKMGF